MHAFCVIDRALSRALQMESYPKFHNEVGVPIVRMAAASSMCIGDKPPQDHPHVLPHMGDASEIICPYALRYSFLIDLGAHEADPADIVLTVTWTELKSSNQRQAPSSCSLGAFHDGTNRHDARTNDSGCARRLFTVGHTSRCFPAVQREACVCSMQHELKRLGTTPSQSMVVNGVGRPTCMPPPPNAAGRSGEDERIASSLGNDSDRVLVSSLLRTHAFRRELEHGCRLGLHIGV